MFGRKYRMRSIPNIIYDMKKCIEQKKPNVIFFVDDNFVVDKKGLCNFLMK